MKSTFTLRQFQKLKFVNLKRLSIIIGFFLTAFFFSNSSKGQTTPADCKAGCTSNDVQILHAYLSDALGNQLPTNFVCPSSGTAAVYLTLELTTKTPRIGVSIYAKIKNFTPPSTPGTLIQEIGQCFGTTLNQPTNKVTFTGVINWTCGTPIVLTDVFLSWGTGNTNFCTGDGFQCPATSSKCYSLPPGQYIPIVTPNADPASITLCSTQAGGTTAVFDLTSKNSTVIGNQSNVNVTWFSDAALMNAIALPTLNPASYTSASGNVYAKVTSTISPYPYSSSTVTLTVNTTPPAPTISSVAATCSAAGSSSISNYSSLNTYVFTPSGPSAGAGGVISGMNIGTSYTVTSSKASCPSAASASFSNAAMLSTPVTPTINSGAATCSAAGTSSISNYSSSNTYAFTPSGPTAGAGGLISGMTVGTPYTVTANNGSCTSGGSASFSNAAMLTNTPTPTITSGAATCSAAGTSTISNYSSSNTYAFTPSGPTAGAGGLISGMTVGTPYTVTANNGSCTSGGSASFSNAAMLTNTPTPTITSGAATCSAAGTSTISNYSSSNTYAFTPSGPTAGAGGLISGMTVGTSYTVTANNGSCTSSASASFSNAAILATPVVPTVTYNAPACDQGFFTVTISSVISGATYSIADKDGANIPLVSPGNSYTPSSTNNFNFSNIPAGSGYRVTVTNNGCPSSASSCGSPSSSLRTMQSTNMVAAPIVEEGTTVKAYPNPFNSTVKFVVHTMKAGNGSLEVYNIMGQKIKTVFQGYVPAGVNNFNLNLPGQKNGNLIYRFILDKKQITGKLIQLNQ